jgi:hypothetical protein
MKNLINNILLSLLLILSSTSHPYAATVGGKGGDGGNLGYLTEEKFNEIVTEDLPGYAKDVIQRLILIQDSKFPYRNLVDMFIGRNKEILKELEKVSFYTVPDSCPESLNKHADASVSSDGKICFSHRAFKHFNTYNLIIPKLISMTMHELSHLRGFDERQAIDLQLMFDIFSNVDKSVSHEAILFNNNEHKNMIDNIKYASQSFSDLLQKLISRKPIARREIVSDFNNSKNKFYVIGENSFLPKYIKSNLDELYADFRKNIQEIDELDSSRDKEFAELLAKSLNSLTDFSKIIEKYESSICVDDLCSYSRPFSGYTNLTLLDWQIKKEFFLNDLPYPKTEKYDVECKIKDIAIGVTWDLQKEDSKDSSFSKINLSFLNNELPDHAKLNSGWISKSDNKFIIGLEYSTQAGLALIEGDGFVYNDRGIGGILTPHAKEKVSARLGVADANDKYPFYKKNTYYYPSGAEPKFGKEYLLTCELKQK